MCKKVAWGSKRREPFNPQNNRTVIKNLPEIQWNLCRGFSHLKSFSEKWLKESAPLSLIPCSSSSHNWLMIPEAPTRSSRKNLSAGVLLEVSPWVLPERRIRETRSEKAEETPQAMNNSELLWVAVDLCSGFPGPATANENLHLTNSSSSFCRVLHILASNSPVWLLYTQGSRLLFSLCQSIPPLLEEKKKVSFLMLHFGIGKLFWKAP